ncbi:MAG: DUF2336 domain-containing protein [Aestuariivirga sp.]|nr:DUF2336 domain-containing protein [Aestuariivirga sp.]
MNVLDEVGGEMIPNRRITADSFRLLIARLKKKPAFAQSELLPEPAIIEQIEIVEETVALAPVAENEQPNDLASQDIEFALPRVAGKKPWAWLTPADPVEATIFDPLPEAETPLQAAEESMPAAEREPWREIPFEELFAAPAIIEPEPEAVKAEPEVISAESENPSPEPVAVLPEPELAMLEPEIAPPESVEVLPEPEQAMAELELAPPAPTAVTAEPEPATIEFETALREPVADLPEPELGALEPEAALPEPVEVIPEPEMAAAEPVIASPEPEIAVAEPAVVIPEPEIIAPEPVAVAPEPAAVAPAPEIEKPKPAGEKPSLRRKSPAGKAKLGDDLLPLSGMVVQGIGEVSKAIFTTPSPVDRSAFLAEVAALAAADAAWEKTKADLPLIIADAVAKPKPHLRRVKPADDPFAKLAPEESVHKPVEENTDDDAGELARSLLDMMLSNPNAGQPQERALAADALLKLVPRIPLKALVTVVDRISIMESPPHLLVSKLINDPRIEVAGPLLELCNHISDQVLGKVIATGQVSLMRLIARRRSISATLGDQLIEFDDPSVVLTLVRNSGANFSHHAFPRLADHAQRHHALLAPLATRPDLPAPIAFELFWFVPAELRRYLLSRFLTDSETLTKILKITHAMGGGEEGAETKFPDREQIEAFVEFLNAGKLPEAANLLAEIAAIQADNAARIIADANGEPLTIALKAIGTNRVRFGEIIDILKASDFGILDAARSTVELQNIFDSMSFNKARVLLTYWDWAVLKSGPYAPAN